MIDEQDRGLEAISATLRRQQKVGLAMQDEIAEHNVIIDDISAGATLADNRIKRETQRIEERRKKEKTWCTCSKQSSFKWLKLNNLLPLVN
jgi:syntaxin 8